MMEQDVAVENVIDESEINESRCRLVVNIDHQYSSGVRVSVQCSVPTDRSHVVVLYGPSGSGKTTTVRCVAGLERPSKGRIQFNTDVWTDTSCNRHVAPQARRVGYLFQEYALFPHMTVEENIGYPLRRLSQAERTARVSAMMERLQLGALASHRPAQLSGGQMQRVALGRSLVMKPNVLLLDEPLAALDQALRGRVRRELAEVLREFQIPVFLVTHDPVDALAMGDSLVALEAGRVVFRGSVDSFFRRPTSLAAARIAGFGNIVPVTVRSDGSGKSVVQCGTLAINVRSTANLFGATHLCIRAEDILLRSLCSDPVTDDDHLVTGVVTEVTNEVECCRVRFDCGGPWQMLVMRPIAEKMGLAVGQRIEAVLPANAIHLVS